MFAAIDWTARIADPATGVLGPLPQPVVLPFKGTFRMPFAIDMISAR